MGKKLLLDPIFITFVVDWTYGLWGWFLFLFLKGNMLSKQLHKLNNASMFFSALVTTTPEGLLAKQIRIHEIWICCPVFCTLRLNVSCWYCPAMMSVALFPTWWEGGMHRAALPAGCVAQEKLGYGVFESNPQNIFFIIILAELWSFISKKNNIKKILRMGITII